MMSQVLAIVQVPQSATLFLNTINFFIPGLSHHLVLPLYLMILFLHAVRFVVLSSFNPASCHISLTCIFPPQVWPPSSSFPWYVHINHSSQYVFLFHPHHMAVPLESFFCNFLGRLHHSCYLYNVLILNLIPCHSIHVIIPGLTSFTGQCES